MRCLSWANAIRPYTLAAGFVLAMVLTFSCSSGGGGGGGGGGDDDSSSSAGGVAGVSSSSGGGGKNRSSSSGGDITVSSSSVGGGGNDVSSSSVEGVAGSSSSDATVGSSSSVATVSSSSVGGGDNVVSSSSVESVVSSSSVNNVASSSSVVNAVVSSSSAVVISSSSSACVTSWSVTTPSTCVDAGVETEACTGTTRAKVKLDWVEATTPATCYATGLKTKTCPGNASPKQEQAIPQLPWGDWTITKHASQDEHGQETRTCTDTALRTETRELYMCGEVEYDPIDEFCQSAGVKKKKCGTATYSATQFCDFRDNQLYKLVTIPSTGGKTWMAENLNYAASGSKCGSVLTGNGTVGDANTPTCDTYGRLYNWATAMNNSASSSANPSGVQGVCPSGWHLPSDAEWDVLMTAVGGTSTDGTKLKANSSLWSTNTGTDEFGFSALPGGYGSSGGSFDDVGDCGYWWSATESSYASNAYYRSMYYLSTRVSRHSDDKTFLYSVRCVQDY